MKEVDTEQGSLGTIREHAYNILYAESDDTMISSGVCEYDGTSSRSGYSCGVRL
jgi:hypothetical protein